METRFLIIDGNSLACRAAKAHNPHFGPDLMTSTGKPTGGTFRFINMFDRILNHTHPTHVIVGWDVDRDTFRRVIDPSYKANRESSSSELHILFADIKNFLTAIGIKNIGIKGYEGDDIIGTFSAISKADKNFIVSGDRDSFQLVNKKTAVVYPKNGFKEVDIVTEKFILDNYGIPVDKFIDLKTLMGDEGDNVFGIDGCGEKTAVKLIQHYGCAEEVAKNANSIEVKGINKTVKAGILEWAPRCATVKQLVTIKKDVKVPYTFEDCIFNINWENARELFKELEFNSLIRKLNGGEFYCAKK